MRGDSLVKDQESSGVKVRRMLQREGDTSNTINGTMGK